VLLLTRPLVLASNAPTVVIYVWSCKHSSLKYKNCWLWRIRRSQFQTVRWNFKRYVLHKKQTLKQVRLSYYIQLCIK